jgi:hypothetical protein
MKPDRSARVRAADAALAHGQPLIAVQVVRFDQLQGWLGFGDGLSGGFSGR